MFIDDKFVCEGFTAAVAGLPKISTPYLFDGAGFKRWCIGYDLGIELKTKPTDEGLERLDKDPAEQGRVAWLKNLGLQENPYGFGDPNGNAEEIATNKAHTQFERGWRAADDEARAMFEPANPKPTSDPIVMEIRFSIDDRQAIEMLAIKLDKLIAGKIDDGK